MELESEAIRAVEPTSVALSTTGWPLASVNGVAAAGVQTPPAHTTDAAFREGRRSLGGGSKPHASAHRGPHEHQQSGWQWRWLDQGTVFDTRKAQFLTAEKSAFPCGLTQGGLAAGRADGRRGGGADHRADHPSRRRQDSSLC